MRRQLVKLTHPLLLPSSSLPSSLHISPSSFSLFSSSLSSSLRSFHSTPALYALIRSTALKKKEDVLSIAQQDAKKGKLSASKVCGMMHNPEMTPDQAIKIFDLAVKHKVVNTDVCGSVMEFLRDKKMPEHVNHVWKVVNEQNIPLAVGILEVVYDMYGEATDTDKMYEVTQKINTLKPAVCRFYNPIIEIFMQRNERDKAFAMIDTMIAQGARPDSLSYGLIIKLLDPVKDFNLILDTYKKMRNDGIKPSGVTVYMMMEAYGRNGMYDKALEMFDIGKGMRLRLTVNPYISAIRYLGKAGHVKRAFDTFELIETDRLQRGPICYHTMIEVFATNSFFSDALVLLGKMSKEGYKPSLPTFSLLLDPLLAGTDIAGVEKVVEIMRSAKVRPDEAMVAKFAEFEKRNGRSPFWAQ